LKTWAAGPSETEQTKSANAERVVREALQADSFLKTLNPAPKVFVQGSYRANTNVRADSDVDVCILLPTIFARRVSS
jgi:tRNA nucleotidyltransferase (CCA-adding enzyme)